MTATESGDSLQPGQLFGRYLVVDRVGAGGVGEVYAAYDPSLDRRIALKVMRAGADDEASSQGAEGLVREARALASLSHPNVVTVHEVGQEDGRVYVAMELVDGRDLEHWIGEDTDRPWRATLDVFIAAGQGLAAAHARGILHRDFKPANVLIGRDDWVRVSDFGLATLLSGDDRPAPMRSGDTLPLLAMEASMTLEGGMVGTPYYMAPEQIDGHATVRSDIYAFCLALHDALYCTRAFQAGTVLALATLKSRCPPTQPDDVRGVPAPVRSAIERGLRPDPDERWQSMDALLERLQRALKPSSRSALPWFVGLAGVAAGVAVLARDTRQPCTGAADAIGPIWSSVRSSAVAEAIGGSSSPIATQTQDRLAPRLDAFADTWTTTHAHICEATQRGEQSSALLDQRMTCLQRQLLEFDAVLDVLEAADRAVVQRAVRVANALPDPAWCASETVDPEASEASPDLDAARAELAHVNALLAAGKYDEAGARSERLLASAKALGAPRFLGKVLYARGNVLYEQGKPKQGADMLEQAAFQGVASNAPRLVLRAANMLTVVESEGGDPDAGLRWSRLASATLESAGSRAADRAVGHANRASAFAMKGDDAAAEKEIRRALEFRDTTTELQRSTLLQTLSGVLFTQARFDEAVLAQTEALQQLEKTLGPDHPAVALGLFNLGTYYLSKGQFEQGDGFLAQALKIQKRTLGPTHTDVGDTLNSMGISAYQQGKAAEALDLLERAFEIKRVVLSEDHPRVLDAHTNLALLVAESGDLERSAAMYAEIVERIAHADNVPASTKASALFNFGLVRVRQDRLDDANALYEQALELEEQRLGPDDPRLGTLLVGLGVLRKKQERLDEALALYQRALALHEVNLAPNHPSLLAVLNNIASTQLAVGASEEAQATAERLLAVSEGRDDYAGRATFLLAQTSLAAGQRAPALKYGAEALALHRKVAALADELPEVEAFVATSVSSSAN